MITAQEARKQVENAESEAYAKEREVIEKAINKAVSSGSYSICIDGQASPAVGKWLRSLGYKVESGSQCNESYISISW